MRTKILFVIVIFLSLQNNIFTQNPLFRCRNGLNINILDNSTVKDSVQVAIGSGYIIDVNLRIDTLVHSWVEDVSVYLRKGNKGVNVFNKTGGSGDNFIGTILNDSGAVTIDSAAAPFTGTFRPHMPLSIFNNIAANGYWILSVTDTAAGDTGYLRAWCLVIRYGYIEGGIQTVEIPNTYRLYQNYPNPFNPVTKIRYGVPKNGYVKMTVYDELGKEVDVIDEGYKEANMYEAEFNATNLPSGVYYYKLEAEGFADTKKMVILK